MKSIRLAERLLPRRRRRRAELPPVDAAPPVQVVDEREVALEERLEGGAPPRMGALRAIEGVAVARAAEFVGGVAGALEGHDRVDRDRPAPDGALLRVPVVVEERGRRVGAPRAQQRRRFIEVHVAPRVLPVIGMEEQLFKVEKDIPFSY